MLGAAMASGQLSNDLLERLGLLDSPLPATANALAFDCALPLETPSESEPVVAQAQAISHAQRRVVESIASFDRAALKPVALPTLTLPPAQTQAVEPVSFARAAALPQAANSVLISPLDEPAAVLPPVSAQMLLDAQYADASWRTPNIDHGRWSDLDAKPWPTLNTDVGRDPIAETPVADVPAGESPVADGASAPSPIPSDGFDGGFDGGLGTDLPYDVIIDGGAGKLIPPPVAVVPEPTTAIAVLALLGLSTRRTRRERI